MPGGWLTRAAERCLHGETFELVVSPAIADMQFEHRTGHLNVIRQYIAVWKALAGGLFCDATGDLCSLREDLPALAAITLLQVSYYAFLLLLLSGFGTGKLTARPPDEATAMRAAWYVTGVALLCLVPTVACFWPPRRSRPTEG